MRGILLAAGLWLAGCSTAADEITLTSAELNDVRANFEASLEVHQKLSGFVFHAARGDIDLLADFTSISYDPPAAANGFTATITITDGTFSFGRGDLTLTFQASQGGAPVDPYVVDLSSGAFDVDATVDFVGTSLLGAAMTAAGDVTIATITNALDSASAAVTGRIDVDVNGYEVDLTANDLELAIDMVAERVTSAAGRIDVDVDIPDFAFDAEVAVDGVGTVFDVALRAADSFLGYSRSLFA